MKKILAIVSLATAAAATPASAATFDLFNDFGSSVFSYGTRAADGTFTSFAASNCNDIGISQSCYRGSDTYQLVAQRPGPAAILVHPGPGATENTAVRFTAPNTSTYSFNVQFDRADSGDGVGVSFFNAIGATPPVLLTGANSPFSAAFTLVLMAGESVGFTIDRGGVSNNYFGDSTFVTGSAVSVPETATWAMMILGFGLAGYAMRRAGRRAQVTFDAKRLAGN